MPHKNKEARRAYVRRHYANNREEYRNRAHKQYDEAADFVRYWKESRPCFDCGEFLPFYLMEFDHVVPTERRSRGVTMMTICASGLSSVARELMRCELVCAMCHKARTYWRRKIL